jgi:hypothetical protein
VSESDWITLTISGSGEKQRTRKSGIDTYGPADGKGGSYVFRLGRLIYVNETIAYLRKELES